MENNNEAGESKQMQDSVKTLKIKKSLRQDFKSLDFFGRLLIGIAFIVYGYSFFWYMQGNSIYIPFLPAPLFWLLLTGASFILSGILLILKICVRKTSLFLALFYSIITVLVYFAYSEFQMLFLNIAIIGGLIMTANSEEK